jgi:transcription-repair coupling factor (superfamily II helicase)
MTLAGLLDAVIADPTLARAVSAAGASHLDLTAPGPVRPFAVAALAAETARGGGGRTVLAVTATGREAEDLLAALRCLLPPDRVALYPSWETLPHEKLSPRADTVGQRLAVLRRLAHPSADDPTTGPLSVVVAPVRSVLQPQAAGLGDLVPVELHVGGDAELEEVVAGLAGIAYARVDLVEKRGEFAVRGGILDVFPPTEEHPVRVEFFGDTVEEIRYFKVADQRSLEIAEHGLWAPPCRELLLTDDVRARAALLAKEQQDAGRADLAEMLDKLAVGIPVEGMEALAPVLIDDLRLVLHELPAGTHVLLCDPERIRARAADLVRTSEEFLAASWAAAATGGSAPIDLGAATLRSIAEVRETAGEIGLPWWTITPFTADEEIDESALVMRARAAEAYRGDTERAVADLKRWVHEGWRVALLFDGHGPAQRAVEVLRNAELAATLVPGVDGELPASVVTVSTGQLDHGFSSDDLRLAILTEADLTGSRGVSTKDMRRMPSRRRHQIDPLELQPGDLVVHEQHGVGRYVEMVRRTVNGGEREYLILEYAAAKKGQPADRLYVPTDALDQVTRYVGGESPSLNRLGGADWAKTKGRAKKAVKEIAGELIRLYAARTSARGHAFGADTPWQRELEDAFPYVETPDQLEAINEVKADMERTVPMDRVICGDVGYGKTEIAVRAAFKAVQDGKQVAILVPTTLLAQQHFATFTERMAQFPVKVAMLSRFNSATESEQTIEGLADGTVDIVIGTHRLIQSSTRFRDLGLVVVDEEQRFGVEHKEHLKHLRAHVDVLTMSATPIPRTLEMSLTGIREMSTILTPPEERHPVLTFVGPYDDRQIAAAIRRELLREGQVFFVHNRVDSIDRATKRLAELVPEARIAAAHGQMGEHVLERVIGDFWEKRTDVLVCTTIVETGLDISNANTLIVERADALGLSQLHQLRGRVGRGRERAYSYFLYPPEKPLTETAHDRLATIAQHSDLGAGMYVAMKDLEIRGAGNLLGGEQSGHIAGVGFDLYVRLVGEAVAEYRGDAPAEVAEIKVDLPINAHLPHDYVTSDRLRLEAYKRLAAADTDEKVAAVAEELRDRYGTLPEPVANLIEVARFRALARRYGVTEVSLQGNAVRMSPVRLRESQEMRLLRLYPRTLYKNAVHTIVVPRPGRPGQPTRDLPLLDWCRGVLEGVLEQPVAAGS